MAADTADALWTEELPPPIDLPPADTPEDATPGDLPICPTCNEPIIRDPSWKRMRKYHDGCAPTSHKAGATARTGTGTRVRTGGKAEKEADRCEQILRGAFVKAALAVSVVDKFDAFCIMVNADAICTSFRAVCLRYDDLRREILKVPEGGSVFGLALSAAFMFLPIAAHHGLIPSKRIAEMLVRTPVMLYGLMNRMKEGEDGIRAMMAEHMAEMKRQNETHAAERRANGNGQYVESSNR